MYLYVFIFLMLSAMGLFTEVYLLQASRLWARQKTVAEVMAIWHIGAYTLIKESDIGITLPCRVSTADIPAGVPLCSRCLRPPEANKDSNLYNTCDQKLPAPDCLSTCYMRNYLPIGYEYTAQYIFPSLVYQDGGSRYVITYIPKEATGETAWLGYKASEVYRQMQKAKMSVISYGQVSWSNCNGTTARWLVTKAWTDKGRVCFRVPTEVPLGSIGYISVI